MRQSLYRVVSETLRRTAGFARCDVAAVVMIMINSSAEAGPDDSRPCQYFVDPIKFMPSGCKKLRSHHRAAPKEVTCSKHVYCRYLRKSKGSTGTVSTPHARVVRPPPSPDSAKTGSSTRHTTQTRKTGISHVRFPSVSPETHPNSLKQQQQRGKQNTHPLETPVPTTAPPTKNQIHAQ